MLDFLFLMHDDAASPTADWSPYLQALREKGRLQGGSAIGAGMSARKSGRAGDVTAHLTGFIRVSADSLDDARALLAGNPLYEAGGTVEIRALPRDDRSSPRRMAPNRRRMSAALT